MSEQHENRPARAVRVLPHYALRLRFMVRPVARVFFVCWSCRAERNLDIVDLVERFGADAGIREIQQQEFRCKCGARANSIRAEWLDAGNVVPFPSQRLRFMLAERARFWVKCWPCDREEAFNLATLIERLGADADANRLGRQRFACRDGRGHNTSWRIEWVEDAPQLSTDF